MEIRWERIEGTKTRRRKESLRSRRGEFRVVDIRLTNASAPQSASFSDCKIVPVIFRREIFQIRARDRSRSRAPLLYGRARAPFVHLVFRYPKGNAEKKQVVSVVIDKVSPQEELENI